jgi:hypothetical protein
MTTLSKRLLFLSFLFSSTSAFSNTLFPHDNRQILSEIQQPDVYRAVGKLSQVISFRAGTRKAKVDCSATLIAPVEGIGSDTLVAAKHCLRDKQFRYRWVAQDSEGNTIKKTAKLVYEDPFFDWILLRFSAPVPFSAIRPMVANRDVVQLMSSVKNKAEDNTFVAGYSMDLLGNYGRKVTIDADPNALCMVMDKERMSYVGSVTVQGDSGGAVAWRDGSQSYLLGVMGYIKKDSSAHQNDRGFWQNTSGYFVNMVDYAQFYDQLGRVFLRGVMTNVSP